jgi:hypothetical protein
MRVPVFLLGSSVYVCLQIAKVLQHYEGMVLELHLSHNDITNDGAKRLLVKEVIQHYPIHARGQLRKPLWLRLEQCKVNSRLGLPAWMYTADKQRMKPQPDCPPLQVPHLDLPVPAANAYRNRPPETRLPPRQQPISPAPQAVQAHSAPASVGAHGAKPGPSSAAPAPGGRTLAACTCHSSACNSEWCSHTRVSSQDAFAHPVTHAPLVGPPSAQSPAQCAHVGVNVDAACCLLAACARHRQSQCERLLQHVSAD